MTSAEIVLILQICHLCHRVARGAPWAWRHLLATAFCSLMASMILSPEFTLNFGTLVGNHQITL
jgi:hypothetical protein